VVIRDCVARRRGDVRSQTLIHGAHLAKITANSSALPRRSSKAHERRSGRPAKARGKDIITDLAVAETRKEIEHFCDLGARVIDQSRRRVLNANKFQRREDLFDFRPHTDLIKRGKCRRRSKFGHKVFLAESARGLITR